MDLFHIIDEAQAIIKQNGVFRQVKMYRRGDEVFVASGTGYVRLMARGGTSVPSMSWIDYEAQGVAMHPGGSHRAEQPIWVKPEIPYKGKIHEKKKK